ncbi:MAG: hypothetical protein SFT92_03090 [Rickettsiales bacterium]|nr:hypothetical protein [Rickettsiales bacterium]
MRYFPSLTITTISILGAVIGFNADLGIWPYYGKGLRLEAAFWIATAYLTVAAYLIVFRFAFIPTRFCQANEQVEPFSRRALFFGIGAMGSVFGWALCFLISAHLFSVLSYEDDFIEYASFFGLLAAALLCFYGAWLSFLKTGTRLWRTLSCLAIAFGLFICAMEEISWMQRIFGIQTPAYLEKHNMQKELNFHNLASTTMNLWFYFLSICFLVLIPFFHRYTRVFSAVFPELSILIGRSYTLLMGLTAAGFLTHYWNGIFAQLPFLLAAMVMVFCLVHEREKYPWLLILIAYLVSQGLFMYYVDWLERKWELQEYKECYIAIGFFIYSIELCSRLRQLPNKPKRL